MSKPRDNPGDEANPLSREPEPETRSFGAPSPPDDALTRSTEHEEPREARQLGKYVLGDLIGRGGMGVVGKGFDPDLQRSVAIKVLGEHLAHSPTSRRRFQREGRAAAAI